MTYNLERREFKASAPLPIYSFATGRVAFLVPSIVPLIITQTDGEDASPPAATTDDHLIIKVHESAHQ